MENMGGSHYDRLLRHLNEELGLEPRDMEKEIRMAFENTDDGRSMDINEWDVVFEDDGWKVVADIGSQWSVTETENAEAPFQFHLVEETNESQIDEEDMDQDETSYHVGDLVQIEDSEGNTTIVPKAIVAQVDDFLGDDGEMHEAIEITGSEDEDEQQWYREDEYTISILRGANENAQVEEKEEDEEPEEKEEEPKEKETTDDFLAGGKADDADDGEFDFEQLRMGQHVELEHTDNPAVALEIAKDHLREDPLYYTHLDRMEKGECDHPEDEAKYKRMGKENPHKA